MQHLYVPFVLALVLGTCGPHALAPRHSGSLDIANPFPLDVQGLAGRYQFPDGMQLTFVGGEILHAPIAFRHGAKSLQPDDYDLYVLVASDDRAPGMREVEVGLGDSIALLRYELPRDIGWMGPLRLSPKQSAETLDLRGDGVARIAQLRLERAGDTPVRARRIEPRTDWKTIWLDEPQTAWLGLEDAVRLRARVGGERDAPHKGVVTCGVLDFDHHEIARKRIDVAFTSRTQSFEIPVPPKYGPYLLRCTADIDDQHSPEYQFSIARVSKTPVASNLLGGHGNPALLRGLGAGWNRAWESGGHETAWRDVEPQRGRFVFDRTALDPAFHHLGVLDLPPPWAGANPNLDQWLDYVEHLVRHYAGKFKAWEIFNEPYGPADATWATDHVTRVAAIANVIHSADPQALVLSGGPPEELQGLDRWHALASAGLVDAVQIVTVHLYAGGGGQQPLDTDVAMHSYLNVLRGMAGAKPIWDTESGIGPNESFYLDRPVVYGFWDSTGFHEHEPVPYALAAAMAARLYLVHAWHDVPWFVYQGLPSYGNAWALVDFDGSPLPLAVALAQIVRRFDHARADGVPTLPDGLWGLRFRIGDRSLVAIWSLAARNTVIELPSDKGIEVRDLFDNRLRVERTYSVGVAPLVLSGPPSAIDDVLAKLRISPQSRP